MTDQRSQSTFPPPPERYKQFTSDVAPRMQPPKLPDVPITVFGEQQSFDAPIESLTEQNIPILYDESAPPLGELKKINHKILFSFQKLVGIIADGTESPDESLEFISHLFTNAHHLLHKLRDVQGFENMHQVIREKNKRLDEFKAEFDLHLASIASLPAP